MKIFKLIAIGAVALTLLSLTIVGCGSSETNQSAQESTQSESSELYTCGMHPNVIQEGTGNCPIW